jgi:hypothetical protein
MYLPLAGALSELLVGELAGLLSCLLSVLPGIKSLAIKDPENDLSPQFKFNNKFVVL